MRFYRVEARLTRSQEVRYLKKKTHFSSSVDESVENMPCPK